MTMLLGAVAAVSLLVGGIGIMNIMLVSVTERTREIGIRLAIGALERDVLLQFLVEAVVLSAFGGLVGILVATLASIGLARVIQVPYLFNPQINVLPFLFSAAIGVLFGYFPAHRAARLDRSRRCDTSRGVALVSRTGDLPRGVEPRTRASDWGSVFLAGLRYPVGWSRLSLRMGGRSRDRL
jgi:hypothetical protein